MYRAVVLTTLVLLLLAIAGVSVAQEGRIFADGSNNDDSPGSAEPERTSVGATVTEDPQTSAPPSASSESEDGEDAPEATVVTEPTVEETEQTTVDARGVEETRAPGSNYVGKPEHARKVPSIGKPPNDIEHPGKGKPEELENKKEHGRSGSQRKVTLCHKDKTTLTIGTPALPAHLRHGDTQGACHIEGSGPAPSAETMGPEAAKNGESDGSGGQEKITLCHTGKSTLTVGASAQAAHLRHGDGLGACR